MSAAGFSFIQGPAQHRGPETAAGNAPRNCSEELGGAAGVDLTLAEGVHAVKLRSP